MGWDLFPRWSERGFEMVGLADDLLDAAPIASLPVEVEVVVDAPSALPDALGATERELAKRTVQAGGRVAATVRSDRRLRTKLRLPAGSDDAVDRIRAVEAPRRATISVHVTHDPEWTRFDEIRPVEMETQALLDHRVLAELFDAGDVGGPRTIEHVVSDIGADRLGDFMESMLRLGLAAIASSTADPERTSATVRHELDPSEVTPDAWTIRTIAERVGATYEGWRCPIVRR